MSDKPIRKVFTGWHMTAILVGFFSTVIAVNVYMAHAAISTFGGTVVDNSYVASQEFNGWLAAAKKQQQLGWKTGVSIDCSCLGWHSRRRAGWFRAGEPSARCKAADQALICRDG